MKRRITCGICVLFSLFLLLGSGSALHTQAYEPPVTELLLQEVNAVRSSCGLSLLTADSNLALAAGVRAREITTYFSHTRPNGTPWYTVDYYRAYGETLASGCSCTAAGARTIVNSWMDSPAHAALLLCEDFTSVGFGVRQSTNGTWYWVAELGYGW